MNREWGDGWGEKESKGSPKRALGQIGIGREGGRERECVLPVKEHGGLVEGNEAEKAIGYGVLGPKGNEDLLRLTEITKR